MTMEQDAADAGSDAQAIPADEVQPEAVTTDLTADATPDGAADADTSDAPAGLTDPDSIEALWERYPTLREQHEQTQRERDQEREIAGANRERARLQREAGKKDSTRRNVTRALTDLGYEVEDTAKLDYFYDLAAANAAHELAQAVPDAVLRNHPVPVEVREAALEARERGDWDGYVSTLLNGAVEAKDAERQKTFDQKVKAESDRRVAAETAALRAERAPVREGAPPRPAGQVTTPTPYHLMTFEQRQAMSPQERDAAVAAGYGA